MNKLFNYILPLFSAIAVTACSSSDNHSHVHEEHAHHSHEHVHGPHETHTHVHETHEHEIHEHDACNAPVELSHEGGAVNLITFTKVQQSKIDFAIEKVVATSFNGAVKVAAKVSVAPENLTTVVATSAGRLRFAGNVVAGKEVCAGETLFFIDGGDVTDNDVAVKFAAAESSYHLAKADYERKKSLYNDNIVSLKELQASEATLKHTEAHYNSMQRGYNGGKMILKAPMTGYISSLLVENGSYVESGTPIAEVQRNGNVNITAELPVRYAQAVKNISSVNVELSNGEVCSLDEIGGRVVAVGLSANSCNMIPITVSAKTVEGAVPGSIVTLHLVMSLQDGIHKTVVPRTSLVEEMGNYFVFIHKGGDTFEKREVRIGTTDGRVTQILKGVDEGEYVVSQGAMSLKLSQGAATLDPHAGHVH